MILTTWTVFKNKSILKLFTLSITISDVLAVLKDKLPTNSPAFQSICSHMAKSLLNH